MAKSSKFIQIATASAEDGDTIYALDDEGVVWCFNGEEETWEALPDERSKGE